VWIKLQEMVVSATCVCPILVVDDDPLNLVVLQAGLEEAGFQVMLASHADEAVIKLKRPAAEIAALITDIRLPGSATAGMSRGPHET
jgi:CheY-like chemotaxis protein